MAAQTTAATTADATTAATPDVDGRTYVVVNGRWSDLKARKGESGEARPFALVGSGPVRRYDTAADAERDTERKAGKLIEKGVVYLTREQADAIREMVAEQAQATGKSKAAIGAALFASGRITIPESTTDVTETAAFAALFGIDDDDDADATPNGDAAATDAGSATE